MQQSQTQTNTQKIKHNCKHTHTQIQTDQWHNNQMYLLLSIQATIISLILLIPTHGFAFIILKLDATEISKALPMAVNALLSDVNVYILP